MNSSGNNKRALKSILPKHHIGDELWDNIEQQLSTSSKLQEMPQHTASDSLWDGILLQLNTDKRQQRRRRYLRVGTYVSGIAASLILILYFIGPFQNQQAITQTIVMHTEEIMEEESPSYISGYEKKAEDIIEYCTNFPNVCVNPEFVTLKSKWYHLKDELIQLKILSKSGNNTQVKYYITRIEMDIEQLENKMMHMFL